jgi:hypothetical protein
LWPASARFLAMGAPILPNPIKPILILLSPQDFIS